MALFAAVVVIASVVRVVVLGEATVVASTVIVEMQRSVIGPAGMRCCNGHVPESLLPTCLNAQEV